MILYSTDCPRCQVLKKKLDNAGINYEIVSDVNTMIKKGIISAPMLEIESGKLLSFMDAINWLKEQELT